MSLKLKDPEIDAVFARLAAPSTPRWRMKTVKKGSEKVNGKYPPGAKAAFIPYIDARFVAQTLDDVVGPQNWRSHVAAINPDGSATIRLSIRLGEEWIEREDVGYPNNPDSKLADADQLKGAVSDGLKRAAVQFGIGRFLYALKPVWTDINEWGEPVKPINVGRVAQSVAGPVDPESGELLGEPPSEQNGPAKARKDVSLGDDADPASWTGARAFWRNKVDGAGSAPALDKISPAVYGYAATQNDGAMADYIGKARAALGLPPF